MSADNLDSLPDAQLDELFAVEVAGWKIKDGPYVINTGRYQLEYEGRHIDTGTDKFSVNGLKFCASADSVLPWLEKAHSDGCNVGAGLMNTITTGRVWNCRILDNATNTQEVGIASTFARAAVICLLRAQRAKNFPGLNTHKTFSGSQHPQNIKPNEQ